MLNLGLGTINMEKRLTEDERQFVLDAVSYAAEHETNDDICFKSGRLRAKLNVDIWKLDPSEIRIASFDADNYYYRLRVTSKLDRKGRFENYPNVDVTVTMRKLRMYSGY